MKQVREQFALWCTFKNNESNPDKDYRKGVHWLETLRIRRVKILEGAFKVRHTS